jgi:hypothetical protein
LHEGDPDRTLISLDPMEHYNVKLLILFYFVNTNVKGKQLLLYLFNALQKRENALSYIVREIQLFRHSLTISFWYKIENLKWSCSLQLRQDFEFSDIYNICVLEVLIFPLSTISLLDLGTVLTVLFGVFKLYICESRFFCIIGFKCFSSICVKVNCIIILRDNWEFRN